MWTNVIFALATLVSLAILDYNFKKDRNKLLYALGGIDLVASVACFILTSIDLARLKAPRAISPDQRNRIAEKMKQFAGQEYTGLIGSGVADAGDLWREIGLSLDSAGWQFWCCIPRTIARLSAHEVSITPVAPEGILILWQVAPQIAPAEALAKALTAEGILAGSGPTMSIGYANTVVIEIGPKPQQ